jgi:hypothetical protein
MTYSDDERTALDNAQEAARQLMQVLNLLADDPPPQPDERQGLLARWGLLADQLDDARTRILHPREG